MSGARPPSGRGVPGNRWDLLDGQEPDEPPVVSVIVVHYDQAAELERTLAALRRQTHPPDRLEIIVVDDASPQPPVVPADVRLIVQPEPGFHLSAARNLGARAATGSVLCFLDADTAPEPDYVRRLTRLPALLPEAVTVGRRRHAAFAGLPTDAPIETVGPASALPAPGWLEQAYERSRDLLDADDRSYRYVIGAVTACSRWFFVERVGGFDEDFTAYGGEDWEWAHRAWLAGAVFAHVPDAVAWHDGADWAGREDDGDERQARKNAETLLLADRIPVAGSRGLAVRSARPDVVAVLADAPSAAAAFVSVDSLLVALPDATVVVPDAVAGIFAADARVRATSSAEDVLRRCRVRIDLPLPVRIRPGAAPLLAAMAAQGVGDAGILVATDAAGGVLLRAESSRARARAAAWPAEEYFATRVEVTAHIERFSGEPSLAAYLGGWG